MTLEKRVVLDKIEVLEDGQIQIRQATVITEDGIEISRLFHRSVVCPGDAVKIDDKRLSSIIAAVWTDEVISVYQEKVRGMAAIVR